MKTAGAASAVGKPPPLQSSRAVCWGARFFHNARHSVLPQRPANIITQNAAVRRSVRGNEPCIASRTRQLDAFQRPLLACAMILSQEISRYHIRSNVEPQFRFPIRGTLLEDITSSMRMIPIVRLHTTTNSLRPLWFEVGVLQP